MPWPGGGCESIAPAPTETMTGTGFFDDSDRWQWRVAKCSRVQIRVVVSPAHVILASIRNDQLEDGRHG